MSSGDTIVIPYGYFMVSFPYELYGTVPYTFASINRRNAEARGHIAISLRPALHYSVDLPIQM